MKKVYYLVFALLLTTACKKGNTVKPGNGTIILAPTQAVGMRWQTISDDSFSADDSTTTIALMKANNLSTDGFLFYTYESYNALDQNNQMGYYQIAEAMQIRNGLPVFSEDITFAFENGKLNQPYPAPQLIVGNITLDNKPNLTLQTLRNDFIKVDNASEANNISIQDSTLVAQLGYYNLNINQQFSGGVSNYIKAWYVHPQHSSWPKGYFRDDNGSTLSFEPFTHSGPVNP
jgi:hypothetical protein